MIYSDTTEWITAKSTSGPFKDLNLRTASINSSYYSNTKVVTKNYKTCTDELPEIKKVIFNDPATIVFWADGTKTVVKCMEGKKFNTWDGLSMAICKKLFGKSFKRTFRKWCEK